MTSTTPLPFLKRQIRSVVLAGLGALALAACAPGQPGAAGCDVIAAGTPQFSSATARDRVETRIVGADCDHGVGLLTIATADGTPVYAFASPLYPRFGTLFEPRGEEVPRAVALNFVHRWAELSLGTTWEAPPWPEGGPPPDGAMLERTVYEDVRSRRLPMACHLSGVARQTCVYWEPALAAAAPLFDRNVDTAHAD